MQQKEKPTLPTDVKPLTQEALEDYWKQTADTLGLAELMSGATVRLGEKTGVFEIDAQNTWFHDDFKQHKYDVLGQMRALSGMPMLDCKVNPKFVESEELTYSPDKKYNAMLERNRDLMALRRLFPNIDY